MFGFNNNNNNGFNNNNNNKANGGNNINGRSAYEVLTVIPKWSIFCFHLRAISVGLWVVTKWSFAFIWSTVNTSKVLSRKYPPDNSRFIEYYGVLHDKPPPCLVDNRIGLQSYVKLKGTKLHYVEAGSNSDPFILLLHGFPDCWLGWHNQIKELSRFFRVVAIDLKGFNDSDKPQWRSDYSPEKICSELVQFIRSLGVNSATIIGHDLGAVIGWIFAHTHPENVDRFISVSAPHPNLMWENLHTKSHINDSWLKLVQIPYLAECALTRKGSQFLESSMKHIQKDVRTIRNSSMNGENAVGDISHKWDAYKYVFSQKSDWTGPLNYYRNFPFYRIKSGEVIRCPCLIITGNEDTFCRLDSVVKSTEYCDNFLVKIIENSGHWPHQEMPEEFNRVILKFLVGHRANMTALPMDKTQKGIMGRMLGAVTNGVKMGGFVLDSVHQRTNEVIQSALH